MSCSQVRTVKSCHGCGYEDVEKCLLENKHLPGNKFICSDCIRNPEPTDIYQIDRFISREDAISHLQQVLKSK